MSSPTIFLEPGMSVVIDGVEMSYEDIMNSKIDSILYRKHLKELIKDEVEAWVSTSDSNHQHYKS